MILQERIKELEHVFEHFGAVLFGADVVVFVGVGFVAEDFVVFF
jgi:hypothetical protein